MPGSKPHGKDWLARWWQSNMPTRESLEQSRAGNLQAGDQQEDADQQAERDAARHRAAREAPQFGREHAVRDGPQQPVPLHRLAGRQVTTRPRRETPEYAQDDRVIDTGATSVIRDPA